MKVYKGLDRKLYSNYVSFLILKGRIDMIYTQENSEKNGIILNQDHSEKHVEIPMDDIPKVVDEMLSKYLKHKEGRS